MAGQTASAGGAALSMRKVIGKPIAKIAARIMAGEKLKGFKLKKQKLLLKLRKLKLLQKPLLKKLLLLRK